MSNKMYQYTGCGLNYVFLKNGFTEQVTPYGVGVSIHDLKGLHRAIAMDVVENRPELSPDEFRFLRKELEFTQTSLGQMLGRDAQSIAKWEKGEIDIPVMAANFLRAIYRERAKGNAELEKMINRLNSLDRELYEVRLLLTETGEGWHRAA
jgi:DNA-binding transcriptional regulator YiaG